MSLDVYLEGPSEKVQCCCSVCGHEHLDETRPVYYSQNCTHNLGPMAKAAGLYYPLWRPEEIGIETADQLVPLLQAGLAKLEAGPTGFRALNPENGWGDYEGFLDFVREYLHACRDNPEAHVRASR